MAALLSLDQAPPIAAPLRFFLSAPLFGMAAALLVVYSGGDLFASRWTPAALATTHLLTVGFMLQVMVGALFQLLPVVAGAAMRAPLASARWVHAALSSGAAALAGAFLTQSAAAFALAGALLGAGIVAFVVIVGQALRASSAAGSTLAGTAGDAPDSATVRDIKRALVGLTLTLGFGVLLAAGLAGLIDVPLLQLADIHLSWGLVVWGGILLGGVALVVVPMFQLTPSYPGWFERHFSATAFACIGAWTLLDLAGWHLPAQFFAAAAALAGGTLASVTIRLQEKSKRARLDTTGQYWRFAMGSTLAACLLWLVATPLSALQPAAWEWQGWPLLFAVLLVGGGFMSAMSGMLYKIVPFIVWLHARKAGRRVPAPNMRQILGEAPMLRQARAHFLACALLALATIVPDPFAIAGGAALFVAQALLLDNLAKAAAVYREHLRQEPAAAAAG